MWKGMANLPEIENNIFKIVIKSRKAFLKLDKLLDILVNVNYFKRKNFFNNINNPF